MKNLSLSCGAALTTSPRGLFSATLIAALLGAITISDAGQAGSMESGSSPTTPLRVAFARDNVSVAGMSYTGSVLPPGEGKNVLDPKKKDEPKPPRWFHYSVRLGGRFLYSDNINAARVDPLEDFILSLEPGLSIGIGDVPNRNESYIRLDYSPNALLFADNSEFNIIQHFIHLEALAKLGRLSLTFSQDVQLLEGTDFDFNNPNNFGDPSDPNNRRNRDVSGRMNSSSTPLRLGCATTSTTRPPSTPGSITRGAPSSASSLRRSIPATRFLITN
jgi:hypothetical protein